MFKKILIIFTLILVIILPNTSLAITSILDTKSGIIERAECSGSGCTLNTFVELGVNVANYILGIVGALTLLMFIYGGFMWILSGGSSDKVQKGKDIIIGSVVGLVIVFSSYLIISFVSNNLLGAQGEYKFTGKAPEDKTSTTNNTANTCTQKGGTCKYTCPSGEKTVDDGGYCAKQSQESQVCCELIELQGSCQGECVIKYVTEPQCTLAEGSCNGGVATCCQPNSLFICNGSCLTRLECPQDRCVAQNLGYCAGDGKYCCSGGCNNENE